MNIEEQALAMLDVLEEAVIILRLDPVTPVPVSLLEVAAQVIRGLHESRSSPPIAAAPKDDMTSQFAGNPVYVVHERYGNYNEEPTPPLAVFATKGDATAWILDHCASDVHYAIAELPLGGPVPS